MSSDLVVAVYLNQRLVFDLVAMLQNGIAAVTRLERSETGSETSTSSADAKFSLADAFSSLLKIQLSGAKGAASAATETRVSSEERTHTPASLFGVLRGELAARSLIVDATTKLPAPGDFVEFTSSLKRNPLVEGLDSLRDLMVLVSAFFDEAKQKQGQKPKSTGREKAFDAAKISLQIKQLSDSLKSGTTQDLVSGKALNSPRSVVTLESQFLIDPSMSDLIDGTFRVLGKVTRVVGSPDQSISLIRKASLNVAPDMLTKLKAMFSNLQVGSGFNVPEMEIDIPGPVFQVIPIAIYT